MGKTKWQVNVIDGRKDPGEISLIKSTFHHGKESYGWFGEDKIPIFSLSGFTYEVPSVVWKELIKTAKKLCKTLNKK